VATVGSESGTFLASYDLLDLITGQKKKEKTLGPVHGLHA